MKAKALILTLSILSATPAMANNFYLGITYSRHKIYPYAEMMINKSTPNNVNKFKWNNNHHLYWGSMMLVSGYVLRSRSLKIAGGLIVFDDVCQHGFNIQSPFHLMNNELGKWAVYRNFVNKFE
jgi:hypothetical protein